MIRRGLPFALVLAVAAFLTLSAAAQLQQTYQQSDQNTVVTPQQFRRAEPPSPTATPVELELKGDELREQKMFADSMDYYRAALAKTPNNASLHNKLGIAAMLMQRFDISKKEFERALKLDKSFPEAYNNLGVVYYNQKRYKNAIKEYLTALQLREVSASFHSNLGSAYFARKEYVKANEQYLRALEIDPDIFERRSSGGIAAHLTSPEERAHFDYVIAKNYAKQGNAERALHYLRKAMEEGYAKIDLVYKDEEFAALRKDQRFTELMNSKPATIPN